MELHCGLYVSCLLVLQMAMSSLLIIMKGIERDLPENWPCEWNNGSIPFTYNFYLLNPNRLVNVAQRGMKHIETQSCLEFVEYNPIDLARHQNVSYLFFTYSDVLEYCCLPVSSLHRRRVVLITPLCTRPVHAAHATLHAMGLTHEKHKPFPTEKALKVLKCKNESLHPSSLTNDSLN